MTIEEQSKQIIREKIRGKIARGELSFPADYIKTMMLIAEISPKDMNELELLLETEFGIVAKKNNDGRIFSWDKRPLPDVDMSDISFQPPTRPPRPTEWPEIKEGKQSRKPNSDGEY